jgi:hypothetical protein
MHYKVGSYLRDLSGLQFIVVDEADRLIEGGHFPEVKSIFGIINASPSSLEEEVHEDENEEANATANEENLAENDQAASQDSGVAPSGKQKKKKKKKPSPEPTQSAYNHSILSNPPPSSNRQTGTPHNREANIYLLCHTDSASCCQGQRQTSKPAGWEKENYSW